MPPEHAQTLCACPGKPEARVGAQVCLSLLGTWHGTDETQKWHPDTANLWRVLVSIQGMILIGDPYFNEPNVRACSLPYTSL